MHGNLGVPLFKVENQVPWCSALEINVTLNDDLTRVVSDVVHAHGLANSVPPILLDVLYWPDTESYRTIFLTPM